MVRPSGTIARGKQNAFAETGRRFAVMPDRMAETEPAEVYVIHLWRRLPSRVNLTGTISVRFMPHSLAAVHTRFVQSLHKMTPEESGWKSTAAKLTGGKRRVPRRFDYPALLVPRKPSRQSAAISNLVGDALNGCF